MMESQIAVFLVAVLFFMLGAGCVLGLQARVRRLNAPQPEHTDEYLVLKDGAFVPYDPPQYVEAGLHPTPAARARTRRDGIPHSTRRIERHDMM